MRKRKRRIVIFAMLVLLLIGAFSMVEFRNQREANRLRASQRSTVQKQKGTRPEKGFVIARGTKLYLNDRPYRFLGVNIYSLLSYPHGKGRFSCGRGYTENAVRAVIKEVADGGGNVIRLPAYQSFLTAPNDPTSFDFKRFDTVIAEAKKHDIKLIVMLESQWWHCTKSGYKWSDWYERGFRSPYGKYKRSYIHLVHALMARYKDENTILAWQPINEAESRDASTMLDDPEPLYRFMREVTRTIKRLDPNHLVSTGASNIDAPGSGGPFFTLLHQIPGIDLIEAHDYGSENIAKPTELRKIATIARNLRKPFIIGEVGVQTSASVSRGRRAKLVMQKVSSAWNNGASGVLIWSYRSSNGRGFDFGPKDPLYGKLREFSRRHGIRNEPQ